MRARNEVLAVDGQSSQSNRVHRLSAQWRRSWHAQTLATPSGFLQASASNKYQKKGPHWGYDTNNVYKSNYLLSPPKVCKLIAAVLASRSQVCDTSEAPWLPMSVSTTPLPKAAGSALSWPVPMGPAALQGRAKAEAVRDLVDEEAGTAAFLQICRETGFVEHAGAVVC